MVFKCINKERDKNNIIISYTLLGPNTKYVKVTPDLLKKSIKEGRATVLNLKLTSDDKLIDNNEKIKVIFFDIDGVLNYLMSDDIIDRDCLARLIHISDTTKSKLVLSSNWRYWLINNNYSLPNENKEALTNLLKILGDRFIGITPMISNNGLIIEDYRELEVKQWIEANPNVEKFIILDDNSFGFPKAYPNNFIQTSGEYEEGLTEEEMNRAIKMLS